MKTQTQSSLKAMFKLAMLALLMVVFSCSQETVLDPELDGTENLNAQAAKGKKARPIKASLFNFPDPNQTVGDLLLCAPEFPLTRNVLGGNMSHLGKLQQGTKYDETDMKPISGSFGVPTVCTPTNLEASSLETEFTVYYVAANGDQFVTKEFVTIDFNLVDFPDYSVGTFTNTLDDFGDPIPIEIVSGTGRFEGATGELYFVDAVFGPMGTTWDLVGEITY
jgi:hypothetical protein